MKVVFLGFLANCDESVLNIRFETGFDVDSMSYNTGFNTLSRLRGSSQNDTAMLIVGKGLSKGSSDPFFVVRKEVQVSDYKGDAGDVFRSPAWSLMVEGQNYLRSKIGLLSLWGEGHISMPLQFVYVDDDEIMPSMGSDDGRINTGGTFHINEKEADDANNFIRSNNLPFDDEILQMAFDSFELSYQIISLELSFISCMVAIESLLNPSGAEVTYRVSRNLAVLLGMDNESSEKLFEKMKHLYSVRSQIVHEKKLKNVVKDDLDTVRKYTKLALRTYLKTGQKRDVLLERLNSMGFDCIRQW